MYRIETSQSANGRRLISAEQLTREDFEQIAVELAAVPRDARKIGFIAARRAVQSEPIETLWNGCETVARADPGDWIATNMGADRTPLRDAAGNANVYVIAAARFPELYEPEGGSNTYGDIYRPRGTVRAIYLAGGFEILAPWGEMQRAKAGYLIDNGNEVYGKAKETLEKTYAWV